MCIRTLNNNAHWTFEEAIRFLFLIVSCATWYVKARHYIWIPIKVIHAHLAIKVCLFNLNKINLNSYQNISVSIVWIKLRRFQSLYYLSKSKLRSKLSKLYFTTDWVTTTYILSLLENISLLLFNTFLPIN